MSVASEREEWFTRVFGVQFPLAAEEGATAPSSVVPLAPLPAHPDPARMTRLLASNHFDAPLAPFVVAADAHANLVLWGRVPVAGTTGKQLTDLLWRLGAEASRLRREIGVDDADRAGSA